MLRHPVRFDYRPRGLPGQWWAVAGWLSAPEFAPDTLLILIHGGFYSHIYWDFPYQPEVYSCVQWAYERGLATLNIDRLGAGDSIHPPGLALDMPRNAEALHHVIEAVRTNGVGGRRFSRIVTVGHSLGSFTAGLTQAEYGGADAVVLTGSIGLNTHKLADTPQARASFHRRFIRAVDDPRLAARAERYDDDYVTIPVGRRVAAFYRTPPAHPGLLEVDERLKGVLTAGESRTMGMAADACERITVPTLIQVGQYDAMYYDPRRKPDVTEVYARAIAGAPGNFTFEPAIPDTGHNLALHPNARAAYGRMADWLADKGLVWGRPISDRHRPAVPGDGAASQGAGRA